MNAKELAEYLGVTPTAISNWLKEGLPCRNPGSRGRSGEFDRDECVEWVRRNGKAMTPRTDRPGGIARPYAGYLKVTEQEIEGGLIHGAETVLTFVLNNFLIAAAGAIRFGGMHPSDAIDVAFKQIGMLDFAARVALGLPERKGLPERIQLYMEGKDEELAAIAADLVDLWADAPSGGPDGD